MEGYGNLLTRKEGGEEGGGGMESKVEASQEFVAQLQRQVSQMQRQCQFLQYKYLKAKEESALNAQALRQKIGDLEELRVKLEQVSEECEFYQEDRDIFALAVEEAEEQCVEAERRALDAEKRTMEARRREKVALELVEHLMANSSPLNLNNLTQIRSLKGSAIDPLGSAFIDCIPDLTEEHSEMERRLGMKMKGLIQMLTVGQNNLLKAEFEADLIERKNSELRKLLTDILVAFGIVPQFHTKKNEMDQNYL